MAAHDRDERLEGVVDRRYGLGRDVTPAELSDIAQAWAPWRTWCQLHVRSVTPRLGQAPASTSRTGVGATSG